MGDGGIQILWAKSVKWRQIRARWGDFGGQTRDLWAKPSGGFEKSVHFHANFKPLAFSSDAIEAIGRDIWEKSSKFVEQPNDWLLCKILDDEY